MAVRFPLTVSQKQKILYVNPPPPEELTAFGDRYMEAGLLHDSLEFYSVAKDDSSLRRLVEASVESADLLLFQNTFRALREQPPIEKVRDIYERALALGKKVEADRIEAHFLSESKSRNRGAHHD